MTMKDQQRSGKTGAVQLKTLPRGARFTWDTIDAMASGPVHRVKAAVNEGNTVEVWMFEDPAMTGFRSGDDWVFKQ